MAAGADDGSAALRKFKELATSGKSASMADVMKTAMAVLDTVGKKYTSSADFVDGLKLQEGVNRALQRDIKKSGQAPDDLAKLLKTEREMSKSHLREALELMQTLAAELRVEIADRDSRIAETERRLAEVEKFPLRYQGVHEPGKSYAKGSVVSAKGSMWYCCETTTAAPEFGGSSWTLAVKAGRDAAR